jgi:hypothetical protein
MSSHSASSTGNLGVPRPVTGSKPFAVKMKRCERHVTGVCRREGKGGETRTRRESCSAAARVSSSGDIVKCALERGRIDLRREVSEDAIVRRRGERTVGLMNPMGLLPSASRASLIMVSMEPTTGADADVPNTSPNWPSTYMDS